MEERTHAVDHTTVRRWVQRYAPILNQRIRRELRRPNRSWRVDETYVRVAGKWVYLYRAVDSAGETVDFMLSPRRDLIAAKHFLQLCFMADARRAAQSNQCGWTSCLREGDRGTAAFRRTGKAVPLPAVAVYEQYRRTGPPLH
jgi:transposase-like protein